MPLCEKCKEREATVHFTKVDGEDVKKVDLCLECAGPEMGASKGVELGRLLELLKTGSWTLGAMIKEVLGEETRYPLEAYEFVREALDSCRGVERASGGDSESGWATAMVSGESVGHVSGRELLEGIRKLALKKFGKRAKGVLAEWKIFRTEDFGEIVFEMIEANLLAKQPGDSKEDFTNGFDFDEVFPKG